MSAALFAASLLVAACGSAASQSDAAITEVLRARLETSEAKLVVDPIAVDGAFAVAGWTVRDKGGRALLQRGGKGWMLVMIGGDSLRSIQGLIRMGVPQQQAVEITKELAREERNVSSERLSLMAQFAGEVRM
jgi:periplasmic copper chaperone A